MGIILQVLFIIALLLVMSMAEDVALICDFENGVLHDGMNDVLEDIESEMFYQDSAIDSFRVPLHDGRFRTFDVYDKSGYVVEEAMEKFCLENGISMGVNGPCCDLLKRAKHQQHMVRLEKLNAEDIPDPHFAICIATYQRPYDKDFILIRNTSLPSIIGQSYTRWTIILVGDALTKDQEDILFRQIDQLDIPREKFIYRNLDPILSEKNIFQQRDALPCANGDAQWCQSGSGAVNLAFEVADTLAHVTHVVWFGDDDVMMPNHLSNLVRGFKLGSDIKFAFSTGYVHLFEPDVIFPRSSLDLTSYIAPSPCGLFTQSASWEKSINLRLRSDVEQANAKRRMKRCCSHDCYDGIVLANDADLLERLNTMIVKDKLFSSVFIPQVDVIHIHHEDRLWIINSNTIN